MFTASNYSNYILEVDSIQQLSEWHSEADAYWGVVLCIWLTDSWEPATIKRSLTTICSVAPGEVICKSAQRIPITVTPYTCRKRSPARVLPASEDSAATSISATDKQRQNCKNHQKRQKNQRDDFVLLTQVRKGSFAYVCGHLTHSVITRWGF